MRYLYAHDKKGYHESIIKNRLRILTIIYVDALLGNPADDLLEGMINLI